MMVHVDAKIKTILTNIMNIETQVVTSSIEDNKKKLGQLLEKQKEFIRAKKLYADTFNSIAVKAIEYRTKQKTAKTKLKIEYYETKLNKMRKEVFALTLNLDFVEKALQNIQNGIDTLNKELPLVTA